VDGARLLLGAEATEQAVKAARGPRILHLATHGFFLPGSWLAPRGEGALSDVENPLLRSGLAFAGADGLRSGSEDGLLTALEVATLDLRGTRLAVLSACETGLGQAERGEGVYGLRRALAIAGAETQVISLWRVDDAATRALMVAYYGHLRQGGGRAEALRRAQLEMLARRETSHPFYWAGFIVSGNPAALDGTPAAPRFDEAPLERPPAAAAGARGCGCAAAGAEGAGEWLWVGALLAGAARARRRRQSQLSNVRRPMRTAHVCALSVSFTTAGQEKLSGTEEPAEPEAVKVQGIWSVAVKAPPPELSVKLNVPFWAPTLLGTANKKVLPSTETDPEKTRSPAPFVASLQLTVAPPCPSTIGVPSPRFRLAPLMGHDCWASA
jgi:MYXO-CTERM domain-containing protein